MLSEDEHDVDASPQPPQAASRIASAKDTSVHTIELASSSQSLSDYASVSPAVTPKDTPSQPFGFKRRHESDIEENISEDGESHDLEWAPAKK